MQYRFSNIIIGGDLRKLGYPQAVKVNKYKKQK